MVVINNYYYSINGDKRWFASMDEAVSHMKCFHFEVYKNLISPEHYVQHSKINLMVNV